MVNRNIEIYKIEKSAQHFNIYFKRHHFLTIINQVGTFNIRAHPSHDPNGWGSSIYLQPFFPGAKLHSATVHSLTADDTGVSIEAEGKVCSGKKDTLGEWKLKLFIEYLEQRKEVKASGVYTIKLPDSLRKLNFGDMNMMRIASNYLWNVPLLDGTHGNTGDMSSMQVQTPSEEVLWTPGQENTVFWNPAFSSNEITITVHGGLNQFDSVAQGFDPIACPPALKPTVSIYLKSNIETKPLHVFGMMSTYKDDLASDQYGRDVYLYEEYWQDNVGVTPIIPSDSDDRLFSYDIQLRSFSPTT